jgi:hypothetical protein
MREHGIHSGAHKRHEKTAECRLECMKWAGGGGRTFCVCDHAVHDPVGTAATTAATAANTHGDHPTCASTEYTQAPTNGTKRQQNAGWNA